MAIKFLLKQVREQKQMSIENLSLATGFSIQSLQELENKRYGSALPSLYDPPLSVINTLCQVLEIQPGDLLLYVPDAEWGKDLGGYQHYIRPPMA